MAKRIIKLTESQLRDIVQKVINEQVSLDEAPPMDTVSGATPTTGATPTNLLTDDDMFKDMKSVVDYLDGWVDETDLANTQTVINKLNGKCHYDEVKKTYVPAIVRFLEMYKEDENGDDLTKDVQSVGTQTLKTGSEKVKQIILATIVEQQEQSCGAPKTGATTGQTATVKQTIQWVKQSGKFPLKYGEFGGSIGSLQKAMGMKGDTYFGPATEKGVLTKAPEYKRETGVTQDIYNKILASAPTTAPATPTAGDQNANQILNKVGQDFQQKMKQTVQNASQLTPDQQAQINKIK